MGDAPGSFTKSKGLNGDIFPEVSGPQCAEQSIGFETSSQDVGQHFVWLQPG